MKEEKVPTLPWCNFVKEKTATFRILQLFNSSLNCKSKRINYQFKTISKFERNCIVLFWIFYVCTAFKNVLYMTCITNIITGQKITQMLRYVAHSIGFQTFFVQAFKIVVDSWKFTMLLLYILWEDWSIFMISGSNEQLQQQLEYTLLKPDCHRWWISKMQSGHEDTLEERYAIKFCFKLGKNDATETYGMLQTAFGASCINRASVFWVA